MTAHTTCTCPVFPTEQLAPFLDSSVDKFVETLYRRVLEVCVGVSTYMYIHVHMLYAVHVCTVGTRCVYGVTM